MKNSSLNHIFRTIWSEVLNAWVAVSELVSAKGKRSGSCVLNAAPAGAGPARDRKTRGQGQLQAPRLISLAVACCFALDAQANPIGAQIVNGTASINQIGNTLTVTNSPNAIINWQGFSINPNETTRFVQQSAASSVLNRVVGPDPSQLLGTLTSNGRVFLINPAGILVGQGARIDVAGFVASTLNLSNEDFLAGRLNFGPNPNAGGIQNAGSITTPEGGTVYLVAPQVENSGIITTPGGETILAAGNTVQLIDTGAPGVSVEITGTGTGATNLGQILADSGRIGMVGAVLKNSGTLNAGSLVSQGGRIFLKASQSATVDGASRIEATGTTGGTIGVLGNQITLVGSTTLDTSGLNGGGTILIGGDKQGANPNIRNAQNTLVDSGVTLRADAILNGDGGKIIVWADNATRAYGDLSTRGGGNSGRGGFIETSGHYLDVAGIRVSTAALNGAAGTWLLDPWNITITATADAGGAFVSGVWTPSATGSTITAATILSALNAGTAVTITTTGAGAEAGDITVSAPIAMTGATATSLTLQAANNINLNASITSTGGALDLVLNADADTSGAGTINLGTTTISLAGGTMSALSGVGSSGIVNLAAGTVTLDSAANFTTLNMTGGTLTGTGAITIPNTGALNWSGGTIDGTAASMLTTATGSAVTITNNATLGANRTWDNAGSVTWTTTGCCVGITLNGTLNNNAGGLFVINSTNSGFTDINGAGTFNNTGELRKILNGTAGTTGFAPAFNNQATGVVNVNSGILAFSGAGTDPAGGVYNVASGATLQFGQSRNIAGNIAGAGTVIFAGGAKTYTLSGDYNVSGATQVTGGCCANTTVNFTGTVSNAGATISQSWGSLDFSGITAGEATGFASLAGITAVGGSNLTFKNGTLLPGLTSLTWGAGTASLGDQQVSLNTLTLSSGTLTGSNAITIPNGGTFNWSGNVLLDATSAATLTTQAGATTTISGAAQLGANRTWNNAGTATWTVGGCCAGLTLNGIVNNSGVFVLNNPSNAFTDVAGSGTFNNSGELRKQFNTSVEDTGFDPVFNNQATGVVNVQSGTLALNGALTQSGTINIASGATFTKAGSFTNAGTLTINGDGVLSLTNGALLSNTGTINLDLVKPTGSNAGPFTVSAGSATLSNSAAGIINVTGTYYTTAPAGLTFNNAGTVNVAGIAGGAGDGTTSYYFFIPGGTDSGAYNLASGVTLLPGGTRNLNAGTSFTGSGTVLVNTATLNVNTALTMPNNLYLSTSSLLGGSGSLTLNGALDWMAGTVALTGGFVTNGNSYVTSGTLNGVSWTNNGLLNMTGALTLSGGASLTNASTGTLGGTGMIDASAGTITNNGVITPGGAGMAGTLSITGNLNLTGGTLDVDLGGTGAGQSDKLAVTGNVTMGGMLNGTIINGYTPINTDAIPFLAMTGTASGTFATSNVPAGFSAAYNMAAGEAARLVYAGGSGTRTFNNSQNNLDWGNALNWTGGLPGAGDTALISGSFAVTHAYGADTVAALTINALNSLDVSGGSLTVSGSTNVGGTLTVSGGTLSLGGASAIAILNMSSGTLSGAGAVGANTFNWTGGTLTGVGALTVATSLNMPAGIGSNVWNYTFLDGKVLNNAGTAILGSNQNAGGNGADLRLLNGAVINNSGTWDINYANINSTGVNTFNNTGTLNVGPLGFGGTINAALANSGTVNVVQQGVTLGGGMTGNGVFNSAAGTTANVTGDLSAGTLIWAGGLNGTGVLTVTNSFSRTGGTTGSTFTAVSINQASGNLDTGALTTSGMLSLTAPNGNVLFGGALSAADVMIQAGGNITANAPVTAAGNVNLLAPAANSIVLNGSITAPGGLVNLVGGTVSQGGGSVVSAGSGLNITADNVSFGGTMLGGSGVNGGNVSIAPFTPNRPIEIAGASANPNALSLTQVDLAAINPAGSGITYGGWMVGNASSGAITFKGNFSDPAGMYTNLYGAASVSQDPGTTVSGSLATAVSGAVTLNEATNQINVFTTNNVSPSSVSVVTNVPSFMLFSTTSAVGTLDIKNSGGGIWVDGSTTASAINLQSANGITLGTSSALTASGTGNALVLNAGAGGLVNNASAGASALFAANGRWLVYAASPASVTKNGLTSNFRHYNGTYMTYAPGSVVEAGNGFIYASAPGALSVNTTLASGTASNTYGTAPTAVFGYTLTGFVDSEDTAANIGLSGSATFTPALSGTTAAGSYTVNYLNGLASVAGYTFTAGTGLAYTVNPAALTITAALTGAATKVYDGSTAAVLTPGNYLLSGFVGADSATVTQTVGTYAGKSVGSGILVSATLAPTDFSPTGATNLANYTLPTLASGNIGTITPATISAVTGILANNKVYDATTAATLNTAGAAFTGMFAGDVLSVGAATGAFADKNVGVGKAVSVGGITLAGVDAGNYLLASNTAAATASITAASLAITGLTVANKVYDATTAATLTGTATITALGTDMVMLGGVGVGAFADKNAGIAKPVTVTGYTLSGIDAGNYTLQPAGLTASITPATISVVTGILANNKVYDATTAATLNTAGAAFTGMFAGDVLTVGAATGTFADPLVGALKPVSIAGITLAGADAGNYLLAVNTATATADITAAPVQVAAPVAPVIQQAVATTTTATTTATTTTATTAAATTTVAADPAAATAPVAVDAGAIVGATTTATAGNTMPILAGPAGGTIGGTAGTFGGDTVVVATEPMPAAMPAAAPVATATDTVAAAPAAADTAQAPATSAATESSGGTAGGGTEQTGTTQKDEGAKQDGTAKKEDTAKKDESEKKEDTAKKDGKDGKDDKGKNDKDTKDKPSEKPEKC